MWSRLSIPSRNLPVIGNLEVGAGADGTHLQGSRGSRRYGADLTEAAIRTESHP